MALREEEESQIQSPSLLLDGLYCEEEHFGEEEDDLGVDGESEYCDGDAKRGSFSFSPLVLLEQDLFWEDDELVSLISKENETHFCEINRSPDGYLTIARREAVEWILRVNAHYGFSSLTAVFAVNYFDRFVSSLKFQRDKPWMSQLAAVACLSLAAKVEETQVPLLLDLQVEESKFVFEAKTIQRMELLVLSSLQWRMNPVTPISFFNHIARRLGLKNNLHWEFLWRCERLLLVVIADPRFVLYRPSVLATAIMLHVIKEIEPYNPVEYQNQLMGVLKITEEEVDGCCKLILELSGKHGLSLSLGRKRKHMSEPGSPSGVVDAYFSSDSSNDSWSLKSSNPSSAEPWLKRSRTQDQQMRLPSLSHVSVSSPH